jgi:hypothetical protein
MMRFVRAPKYTILEPNAAEVEIRREHVPPAEVAHGRDLLGGDEQRLPALRNTPLLDQVIQRQCLQQLLDLVKAQLYAADVGLRHLVRDLPQRHSVTYTQSPVHPAHTHQDEVTQLGDELVIELVLGIPRTAGDLLGGCEIVQHVQFLCLGRHGLDGLDQPTSLERLYREELFSGMEPDMHN